MPETPLTIFLSPKQIDRCQFPTSAEPIRWVYLGKKFHERARLEKELGSSFCILDISEIHKEVSDEIEQEFNGWIDGINQLNGASIEWWLGSISSRNIYRSNLFQFCCYLEILKTLWKDEDTRPTFIVTESNALAHTIQEWGREREIQVEICGGCNAAIQILRDYILFFLRWANYIFASSLRISFAKVQLQTKTHISGSPPAILINTFIHPESISVTGDFSDRYFPHLYTFIESRGKSVAVLPIYYGFRYNYFQLFSRMRKSSMDFIIPERYLNISDILYIWGFPLHLIFFKPKCIPFRNTNYTKILREDIIKDRFEELLDAIICYRVTSKLKDIIVTPERLICWYENQAISKALSKGFRNAFPGIPIIGAQLFLHYSNYHSLSPIRSEIDASMVPDLLLETSSYQCKLATKFAVDLHCKPCGALRYAHLFQRSKSSSATPSKETTILLLASFDIEETLELISQVQNILIHISKGVRVLIKFHPDQNANLVIKQFGSDFWSERISIFSGNISEALDQASIVISKGSGSIVEAAARGIPVIFLGNQTKLNINPLSGINMPIYSECYSSSDLLKAITKYSNLSQREKDNFKILGTTIRDLFFLPVNDDTLSSFLDPENKT
jgi:hypothetical protein